MKIRANMILLGALLICAAFFRPLQACAAQDLVPWAAPGPWSAISRLIAYDGRVWFANSTKYVNHNSADLYSFDPTTGEARFEQHLFSQDVGAPAISDGLLFWPYEDPRYTMGWGEYKVTDGASWQWRVIPVDKAYHLHVMASHAGALYAGISAYGTRLLRSLDAGQSWTALYHHIPEDKFVSRITVLLSFNEKLYAGLSYKGNQEPKLMVWDGASMQPVQGWPGGHRVRDLGAHDGWLFAINESPGATALWRTDGVRVENVTPPTSETGRAVYGNQDGLWLVTAGQSSGTLWRWGTESGWRTVHHFEGAVPIDVIRVGDQTYVGSIGPDDQGTLWGPEQTAKPVLSLTTNILPARNTKPDNDLSEGELAHIVNDPSNYIGFTDGIRPILFGFAETGTQRSGNILSRRLISRLPEEPISLFGGQFETTSDRIARWSLLWAIAVNGKGCVPIAFLEKAWTPAPNAPEKYLEPVAGALSTIGEIGQSDAETLQALIERLDKAGDPDWLKGDVIGALHQLTDLRFGYDIDAWRTWWRGAKLNWLPAHFRCR